MTFMQKYVAFIAAELFAGSSLFVALTAQAVAQTGLPWQFFMPW